MIRWSLALGLAGGAVAATAIAADPAPTVAPDSTPDWVISHNARRALWSDPALAEMNLGVRVRQGEAFIWGPVLNDELAAEAIARVRLVSGVRTIVSEMYVLPADDLLRQRLTAKGPRPAGRTVSVVPNWDGTTAAHPTPTPQVKPIPSRVIDLVEEARNRQVRFRNLQVDVANGVVTVSAARNRAADAMEFAEIVKKLPGVSNVVLRTTP